MDTSCDLVLIRGSLSLEKTNGGTNCASRRARTCRQHTEKTRSCGRNNSGVNYLCLGEGEKTMSIDARIVGVTVIAPDKCETCQGSGKDPESSWDNCPACHGATKEKPAVRLKLEPRERGGVAGQSVLTILNSPTNDVLALSALIGTEIWGNSSEILIGTRRWARRIGYTQIELV